MMRGRLVPLTWMMLTAWVASAPVPAHAEPVLSWRTPAAANAVVVLVHGLNLDPQAMNALGNVLAEAEMQVLHVSLQGHASELSDAARLQQFQEVQFSDWQADIARAVSVADQRAATLKLPLYLVGFSLGGLLSADYQLHTADAAVERLVLLSPALRLRWSSYLLYPLRIFPDLDLPSISPDRYRANDKTPVSAYMALYEGVGQFNELAGPQLDIPALVVMHPDDELVSAAGVRDFIVEHKLDNWRYVEIDKSDDAGDVLNHVIVDAHAVGTEAWQQLSAEIVAFLTP